MRASASGTPSWSASSAHSIGRSGSRPSRQTKRKICVIASSRQSHAIARRSSGTGLNGCACGNFSAIRCAFACQMTNRYVNTRLAAISAGPFWPFASRMAANSTGCGRIDPACDCSRSHCR
jgi:hypothetical protein